MNPRQPDRARRIGLARVASIAAPIAALWAAPASLGQLCEEQQKLTGSDAAADDWFGDVAIDGNTIVVGARRDDNASGIDAGAAYVYIRSGPPGREVWTQQAKLTASDAEAGAEFGFAPALSGDTVIVGAHSNNNAGGVDAGSAYVFTRAGTVWTEQFKLTAPDAETGDIFGGSVALSGETAVIGAYFDNDAGGSDAGSAYVFECLGIGPSCPADVNGAVNAADLAVLLGAWGTCGD